MGDEVWRSKRVGLRPVIDAPRLGNVALLMGWREVGAAAALTRRWFGTIGRERAPIRGVGTARGHGDLDPPHRDAHQSPDLEQLQPDGAAAGFGKRVWASPIRRSASIST